MPISKDNQKAREKAIRANRLSRREAEIAAFVAQGLYNKEIADKANISIHAVKFHVENILRKLGVNSRYQIKEQLMGRKIVPEFSRPEVEYALARLRKHHAFIELMIQAYEGYLNA